jgi:hypothetical protein
MCPFSSPELRRKLREVAAEELSALLDAAAETLDAAAIRQVFLNPFLEGGAIERLLAMRRVRVLYTARREAVAHPRTPRALALQLVAGLYWRDLVAIGADTRLHPLVRRSADTRLVERLAGMSVGERIAVARRAGPGVIPTLRLDPTPRVIAALLDNPRLSEGLLLPLAAYERAHPQVLAVVARDPRWGVRTQLRRALSLNPATPVPVALALLPALDKRSLGAVASAPRLAEPVRRRAALLAGVPAAAGGLQRV